MVTRARCRHDRVVLTGEEVPSRSTASFAQFVEECTDSLLGTAYLLTHDQQAAEELVQDTLVTLYPHWARVSAAQSLLAYVRRSLINRYLNQQRRAAASEVVIDFNDAGAPQWLAGPDFAHRVDDRDQLRRVLRRLPARQRAAVVLRYFHDLSDQQIAETMGCRAATVRSLICRAMGTLRGDAAFTGAAEGPDHRQAGG